MKKVGFLLVMVMPSVYCMELPPYSSIWSPLSLLTLSADTYAQSILNDPQELGEIDVAEEVRDKLVRRWSAHYPEKVPFFLQKTTLDETTLTTPYIFDEDHSHHMLEWNRPLSSLTIYDTRSGSFVKTILTNEAGYRNTVLSLNEQHCLIKKPHHNFALYDLRMDKVREFKYEGDRSLFAMHFDQENNRLLLVNKLPLMNRYILYSLDPWKHEYEFFLANCQAPSRAFLGVADENIIVHDCLTAKLKYFDIKKGHIKRSVPLVNEKLDDPILADDGSYVIGLTGAMQDRKNILYPTNPLLRPVVIEYKYPFSYATKKTLYSKNNNEIVRMRRKEYIPHERWYITARDIEGVEFSVEDICLEHNFLLACFDTKNWAVGMAKNPQTFNELMGRFLAAHLVVNKNKKDHNDEWVEAFKERLEKIPDPMVCKILVGVVRSYGYDL